MHIKNTDLFKKTAFLLGDLAESKVAREYLESNLNTIKELAKNADLDKIHFKGKKHIKLNQSGSGEDMHDFETKYKKAQSPLMWAIKKNKPELLQYFINCGANVNAIFVESNTPSPSYIGPINTALNWGNKEAVDIMIKSGAKFKEHEISRLIDKGVIGSEKVSEESTKNKSNTEKQRKTRKRKKSKKQTDDMEADKEREM